MRLLKVCFFFVFFVLCLTHLFWPSGALRFFPNLSLLFTEAPIFEAFQLEILEKIRLPRLLAGVLSGAGLSLAGCLCQAMFRNSLASPSVLGVSGASSFFACLAYFSGLSWYQTALVPLGALIGANLNLFLLSLLMQGGRSWRIEHLLLAGLALSALWGSLSSMLVSLAMSDYFKLRAMMHWQLGGLSSISLHQCVYLFIPVSIASLLALSRSRALDILMLGEESAESLGIDVLRLKKFCFFIVSLLVAGVVSVVGLLPFVGLLVPHFTRLSLGPQHKPLLSFSLLNGASLTVFADLLARTLNDPQEMDIGVFTSLLGAPFFLYLLWKRSRVDA